MYRYRNICEAEVVVRMNVLFLFSGCIQRGGVCENTEEEQEEYPMFDFFDDATIFFCEFDERCYPDIDCSDEGAVALYWGTLFGKYYYEDQYVNYNVCQAYVCMDLLQSAKTDCDDHWDVIYYDIFENECGDYKTYEIQ